MKGTSLSAIAAVLLSACGSLTQEKPMEADLAYEMTTFRISSTPDCEDESRCALYHVTYPRFSGLDTTVSASIQSLLENSFAMGDPDAADKTMEQIASEFIANYNEFTKEFSDSGQGWFYQGEARVNVLLDTLISIGLDEEYYTGGAHGGNGRYFINVDPRTGREYKLTDFFKPASEPQLHKAGEEVFRKQRQLADTASLQLNYFEFTDNTFRLNNNFGWTPEGVVFYFNNYEVAPYAAGPTEVFIPMEKIKGWLRNEPAL